MNNTDKTAIEQLIDALNEPVRGDPYTGLDRLDEFLIRHLSEMEDIRNGDDDLEDPTREYLLRVYKSLLPFVGRIEIVERSEESEAVPYWIVFRLDDRFYRYEGVYSSWDDPNFTGQSIHEVKKVQKERVIVETVWDRTDTLDTPGESGNHNN